MTRSAQHQRTGVPDEPKAQERGDSSGRLYSVKQPRSLATEAAETLRSAIRDGRLRPGEQLPSEPVLAESLGLSRGTLRQAVAVLEQEGLLFRRRGLGTFVVHRGSRLHTDLNTNFGVTELIRRADMWPGTRMMEVSSLRADNRMSTLLGVHLGTQVVVIDRTRTANDTPIALTRDYLPSEYPGVGLVELDVLEEELRSGGSLYDSLSRLGLGVHTALAELIPVVADSSLAAVLEVSIGRPLLLITQVDYDGRGRPVLYSEEWLVPDNLVVQVLRRGPS